MAWQHHLFYTIDREITWQQPLSSAAMVFLPARYPKSLIVEEAIIMFGCNNIPYRRRRVHIIQLYSTTNQNGYRYVNMLRYHITYTYVCIGYQTCISYLLSTSRVSTISCFYLFVTFITSIIPPFGNLSTIEILVLISWISASKNFQIRYV